MAGWTYFKNKVTGGVVTYTSVDTVTSSDAEVFEAVSHDTAYGSD